MIEVNIIGAGYAGLITACAFENPVIFESGGHKQNHQALLRFRDKSVADLTKIPFKEVTVHKEIYYCGDVYHQCTISFANQYSKKVAGTLEDRSIWDLETVRRYIAPPDFYDQLIEKNKIRIYWETPVNDIGPGGTIKFINTAPLPVILEACGLEFNPDEFKRSGIVVDKYTLPDDYDVYQTIYFPDTDLAVYRASITGNVLIVESVGRAAGDHSLLGFEEFGIILEAFGIDSLEPHCMYPESTPQAYGKIIALPRERREAILYRLTRDYNIFSIGRFATWRNILLDDVVKDIGVVKRLISASAYGRDLVLSGR